MQLARGEVHTWCVMLDVPSEAAGGFHATLGRDEQDRSARFRFERDRQRYVVAHGALRELLGRYVGTHPGQVSFRYNAFGKPELSPESGDRLRFNLSHSAGHALIAIAAGADVGVDLEYIRALPDHAEIARRFFSAAEVDQLNRLPSHLQSRAFFRSWTRKEAFMKACGVGLESGETAPVRRWSTYTVQPAPGYIGALVVEGSGWRVRRLTFFQPERPASCAPGAFRHMRKGVT